MTGDSPERWARVDAIVDKALDLPLGERQAFLDKACGDDQALRQAAEEWLAACDDPALIPDTPAAFFAAPLVNATEGTATGDFIEPPQIGPYSIVRELGRGGMGTVYLAERRDGELERRVAIKLMRRGTGSDEHLRRRFRDERQILARLDHPNIAALIDGGVTDDGRLYFVMQYVEGLPIDRYCDEHKLSVDARLGLVVAVCAAVQHAHRHQIVHRDLKPGNILVTPDGQPKLLDFGIAKVLELDAGAGEHTRTGERLLTPEYASPEQIRGELVTPASDVHALGVLLHRLLTGQRPFRRHANSAHELERAILDESPTRPSDTVSSPEKRRRLRGDVDAIVLTALRKDPARRYADAGALATDIERHLSGIAIEARGRATAYRLRTFVNRHRRLVAATATGMVLGAVALSVLRARDGSQSDVTPTLAVGAIRDYRTSNSESIAPLTDMLSTNLARTQGVSVLSGVRTYQLLLQSAVDSSSGDAFLLAAQAAGASEVVSGALYSTPSGGLRLDLQRLDASTGTILAAHSATGADLFSVVDSATLQLASGLGLSPPAGSITDVTTRSLAAYRHYAVGLQAYFAGRTEQADSAFAAALRADSMFAMAAYYHARTSGYQWRFVSATREDRARFEVRLQRALSLANKASDRERLIILAYNEGFHLSPAMRAVAETLAVRYPQEIDGHLMLGVSSALSGEPAQSVTHFERVLAMDSASLRGGGEECASCLAIGYLVESAVLMDSLPLAERLARRWLEAQPASLGASGRLVEVLDAQGRYNEAASVLAGRQHAASGPDSVIELAKHWIRAGEFETADSSLKTWIAASPGTSSAPFLYFRALVLRNQGRFREALDVARRLRRVSGEQRVAGAAPPSALVEAQTLLELGRVREAGALFDSIAHWPASGQPRSVQATLSIQARTMEAASRSAANDTARLANLADELERDGMEVLMFRPRDQHHFVRGLLYSARGDDSASVASFERALAHVASDFARANMDLAAAFLRQNRPRDAIHVLVPAARGWFLESTNLHVTLTEVHQRLAQAFEAAGQRDSAAMHWRRVARSWAKADPELAVAQRYAASHAAPN